MPPFSITPVAVDSNVTMKNNLVIGSKGQWLTAFKPLRRRPINTAALKLPSVTDLCAPALSPARE